MEKVLIVGYGIVGRHLAGELSSLHPDIYDKYKPECSTCQPGQTYDAAFICVDTPYVSRENVCDTREVENAIRENNAELYILRSTGLPGTTDRLARETGKPVVFFPEFYGRTQHSSNFEFDFTILGGERGACRKVQQILQHVYDARHTFRITQAKTAELAKYMVNSFLAAKVSFCTQFWDTAREIGVDYEELRELATLDPRMEKANTFVYDDAPYWESHCLDKDIPAIAETYQMRFLLDMIAYNASMKRRFKE